MHVPRYRAFISMDTFLSSELDAMTWASLRQRPRDLFYAAYLVLHLIPAVLLDSQVFMNARSLPAWQTNVRCRLDICLNDICDMLTQTT